jgi:CRISPR-associated protein Csb1
MPQNDVPDSLSLERLRDAVRGSIAAIRSISTLMPAGGDGDKVFPSTYQGGKYATEKRRLGGKEIETVLLDSVQSQANRMEMALLGAYRRGEIAFPLLSVDFSKEFPDIGEITALEAPHRIADAIFRDSLLDGKSFRESGPGERFVGARISNATPLLELCPTALIFGVWDSTGVQGGLGAKFERTIVSEIVGYESVLGRKTASRIDPLQIQNVPLYETLDGDWTVDENAAKQGSKGEPVLYGKNQKTRGKPSAINHGNVTPSADLRNDDGDTVYGGVTISHAVQTTVLSLIALRRLSFPLGGRVPESENDLAARTLLAALALVAIASFRDEGYDLRSRCLLVPNIPVVYELVPSDGSTPMPFSLSARQAAAIFEQAAVDAHKRRLPWTTSKIVLHPTPKLVQLIKKSRAAKKTSEQE